MLPRLLSTLMAVSLTGVAGARQPATLPQPGDPAPAMGLEKLLQAPNPAAANLKALSGQVVVLEFWATWCGPCIAAIPHLNGLAEKFADKPVRFIAVTDEKEAVVRKFLKKRPMHAWIGLDTDRSLFDAYGIRGIPRTVLIDRRGKIAAITSPRVLTETILEQMLAGKPPAIHVLDNRGSAAATSRASGDDQLPALFEVCVRPSLGHTARMSSGPGRLSIIGQPIQCAIATAYGVQQTRIDDRAALPGDSFDIVVTVPEHHQELVEPLLRQALEATFDFTARREERTMDVFVLKVAEGGLQKRLRPTASTGGSSSSTTLDLFSAVNHPIGSLAGMLESRLQRPVLDQTDLSGHFDWEVRLEHRDIESAREAVRDQLGLELSPAREPVEMLVIDKVETRPPE